MSSDLFEQHYLEHGVAIRLQLVDRRSDLLVAEWYDTPEVAVRKGIHAIIDASLGAYPEHLAVVTMALDGSEEYWREDEELREWLKETKTEG